LLLPPPLLLPPLLLLSVVQPEPSKPWRPAAAAGAPAPHIMPVQEGQRPLGQAEHLPGALVGVWLALAAPQVLWAAAAGGTTCRDALHHTAGAQLLQLRLRGQQVQQGGGTSSHAAVVCAQTWQGLRLWYMQWQCFDAGTHLHHQTPLHWGEAVMGLLLAGALLLHTIAQGLRQARQAYWQLWPAPHLCHECLCPLPVRLHTLLLPPSYHPTSLLCMNL
jgi:hypothetical protein